MKRFTGCLGLALFLTASGCASLPDYTESELDTAAVIQNIKCEFRNAVFEIDPHDEWLKYWNAGFILTLNVNQKGSVTADATFAHPVIPQLLTLPAVGGITGEAKRTEKINFYESVKKIRQEPTFPCPHGSNALLGGATWHT